jgi:hypothetical protein
MTTTYAQPQPVPASPEVSAVPERFRSVTELAPGQSVVPPELRSETDVGHAPAAVSVEPTWSADTSRLTVR